MFEDLKYIEEKFKWKRYFLGQEYIQKWPKIVVTPKY